MRTELPHFRAMCRDGSAWLVAVHERERFRSDWMAGKAFWTGTDAYGSTIDVKLADITGLSLWDDARLVLNDEEEAERKSRELTEGPTQ